MTEERASLLLSPSALYSGPSGPIGLGWGGGVALFGSWWMRFLFFFPGRWDGRISAGHKHGSSYGGERWRVSERNAGSLTSAPTPPGPFSRGSVDVSQVQAVMWGGGGQERTGRRGGLLCRVKRLMLFNFSSRAPQ